MRCSASQADAVPMSLGSSYRCRSTVIAHRTAPSFARARGSERAEAGTTAGRRVTTSDRPADPPSDGRATPKVGCRRPRLPPALMLPPDSHSSWHTTSRNVASGEDSPHIVRRCWMTKVTQRVRLLALGGVVGPVVFVVSWAVAGTATSGYSAVDGAISDLAATDASTQVAMTVSFVVFGIGVVAFGFALRAGARRARVDRGRRHGRRARSASPRLRCTAGRATRCTARSR